MGRRLIGIIGFSNLQQWQQFVDKNWEQQWAIWPFVAALQFIQIKTIFLSAILLPIHIPCNIQGSQLGLQLFADAWISQFINYFYLFKPNMGQDLSKKLYCEETDYVVYFTLLHLGALWAQISCSNYCKYQRKKDLHLHITFLNIRIFNGALVPMKYFAQV